MRQAAHVNPRSLVTVVLPAHEAATSIERTLASALAQTYAPLEVVVVDDGSTDGTAAAVERLAAKDARVRLIRQPALGVAAARNRGLVAARGELVATLDADDLWHPRKIECQVEAMRAGGPAVGLVYCWFSLVDAEDRVIERRYGVCEIEGRVHSCLAVFNFVGNGSTPLMRRDLMLAVGGYDESLQKAAAWGCEDWLLYLRLAERAEFRVVREFLVGYRRTAGTMSRDVRRMRRSFGEVRGELRRRWPELPSEVLREHRAHRYGYLAWLCRTDGRPLCARLFFALSVLASPRRIPAYLAGKLRECHPTSASEDPDFGRSFFSLPTGAPP
jgi:glycosyltransferase involved in cell wall biosynthesis